MPPEVPRKSGISCMSKEMTNAEIGRVSGSTSGLGAGRKLTDE